MKTTTYTDRQSISLFCFLLQPPTQIGSARKVWATAFPSLDKASCSTTLKKIAGVKRFCLVKKEIPGQEVLQQELLQQELACRSQHSQEKDPLEEEF